MQNSYDENYNEEGKELQELLQEWINENKGYLLKKEQLRVKMQDTIDR